jgi:hypothetical protein
MNELKKLRIEKLQKCLKLINELKECYIINYPAWQLLTVAVGHLDSIHYLETKEDFADENLGIVNEDL